MKLKTSELTGQALDWAVAKSIGLPAIVTPFGNLIIKGMEDYTPSTDWAQCGQLIDTYLIELNNHVTSENEVEHWATCMDEYIYGSTALEAACRIVVHVKLGDEIEIPDELVEGV
ncbi:phage protein NinX family protein [Xenorhabdus bovienii]|uniref:DUF2591 domain-containing protein n=1 Tax=Xenorhabdus bovienii str. Intermedium TaxID=1379677 RepID=A0A077QC32_XENBV|nr:phage protein NinX family protein [Xenorhabdus bovienii]CDH33752.1 conserved hypothetical protein [Xenorhabdus bovienii str. Intermedium]